MKIITKITLFISVFIFFICAGCQQEDQEYIDENNQETLTASSNLVLLMTQASQNDGSLDDIIDDNSCASVVLPITVIANGQEVIINDEDDYDLIEDIFDESSNDTDTLEIQFPIQVILGNFETITVNSQAELNDIIAACDDNDPTDDPITCIDFIYPIDFFVYDSDQQQIGIETINSDIELFFFLTGLDEDLFINIDFPISVIVEGVTVEVTNNEQLEAILSEADCDDDDDDDDEIDTEEFTQILTDDVWYVTQYLEGTDQTSLFSGYEFTFEVNNTAQANNGVNSIDGTWNLSVATSELDLFFGTTNPFDELDDDWEIIEYDSDIIRLKDVSGGNGDTDYLTFERDPIIGDGDLTAFTEQLIDGDWFVALLAEDSDPNQACNYVDYEFNFFPDGTIAAASTSTTINGTWSAFDTNGMVQLTLNFDTSLDANFEALNDDDWNVVEFDAEAIQLQDVSGGNGGTDFLDFGRTPPTGCNTTGATELEDILIDGNWIVASYDEDGDDQTALYAGYTLDFMTGGSVTVTGPSTINGTWGVTAVGVDLTMQLNFGSSIPFDEFNDDDWEVIDVQSNRVEIRDVSGGGGGVDTLVFEKL